MLADRVVLGTAPITASFFSPLTKTMIVGMLRIPYWVAVEGLSSVFSLKHLSFPAYCCDSSPITGWIIRHGPHQGAQNSTNTGPSALSTSDFHVLSVTAGTANVTIQGTSQLNCSIKKVKPSKLCLVHLVICKTSKFMDHCYR